MTCRVEVPVTRHLPLRSRRAAFPHRALVGGRTGSTFGAWAARLGSIRGSAPLVTRRTRRCVRGVLQHRPLPPTGSLPSALSATAPHGFVRGVLQYYGPIRLLACSPTASPSRLPIAARDRACDCGPDEVSQVPACSLLA